jgi:hypothetical protein
MRRQFIKLTADDVAQMSDSQRIMFDAGRLFELDRILKVLESNDAWWLIDTASSIEKENTVNNLKKLFKGEK